MRLRFRRQLLAGVARAAARDRPDGQQDPHRATGAVNDVSIGPLPAQGVGLLAGGTYLVAARVAFNRGWVLPVVYPLGGLLMGAVGALAVHYLFAASTASAHTTPSRASYPSRWCSRCRP